MPLAVCATPIGNLEDVTLRVLRELAEAELVLCEDTRRTRVLLQRHGVPARLTSYHEHNEAERTAEVMPRLRAGARVALVSDAGLPGVSDPGARLVAAAIEAGVPVTVLPGASAVETALVASGFAAERYQFLGYLPRKEAALAALWEALRGWPWPAVAFESPRRLPATLASLASALPGAARRRLPGADEEVRGDCARPGGGDRGALLRAAPRRDHARSRPRPGRAARRGARRSVPSPSSWPPAFPAARRRISSPASRARPETRSTGALCDESVTRLDNSRLRPLSWPPCCLRCERSSSPRCRAWCSSLRRAPGPGRPPGPCSARSASAATPTPAGQRRGIEIGGSAGETVLAPRGGTVSFAGSVADNGLTVTIGTDDGYSVTLVHLGSIAVRRGGSIRRRCGDRHDRSAGRR